MDVFECACIGALYVYNPRTNIEYTNFVVLMPSLLILRSLYYELLVP